MSDFRFQTKVFKRKTEIKKVNGEFKL